MRVSDVGHNQFDGERPGPGVLKAIWRYRIMCAGIVAACVVVSAAVGLYLEPPAQAEATIALKTPRATNVLSPGLQGDASLARYTAQRARFITSDAVVGEVAAQMGLEDLASVRGRITATPAITSNVVNVNVTASTPEEAVELAATTLAVYRSATLAQVQELSAGAIDSINKSTEAIREQLKSSPSATVDASAASTLSQLQLQASEIEASSALLGDGVEFVVAPSLDSVKVGGLPFREIALGALVGLALAASVAWLRADAAGPESEAPEAADDDDSEPVVKKGEPKNPVTRASAATSGESLSGDSDLRRDAEHDVETDQPRRAGEFDIVSDVPRKRSRPASRARSSQRS